MALPVSDFFSSLITGTCLFFELRHLDDRHEQATAAAAEGRFVATDATGAKESQSVGEPCGVIVYSSPPIPSSSSFFRSVVRCSPKRREAARHCPPACCHGRLQ